MTQVAALFVETGGVYYGLPDVDPWDEARDARLYDGPHPVIAHPPCERWGKYWFGGPLYIARGGKHKTLGDDGGCFAAALRAVRRYGGIIEHPEGSHAWNRFGIKKPPKNGGWVPADFIGDWVCRVEQGHYGHKARKATWLYMVGFAPHPLVWGPCPIPPYMGKTKRGTMDRLSHAERRATPVDFRDLLLSIVRGKEVPMP